MNNKTVKKKDLSPDLFIYLFIYLAALGFELSASHLLGRRSTATPAALSVKVFLR
jgi:hypothetical protein